MYNLAKNKIKLSSWVANIQRTNIFFYTFRRAALSSGNRFEAPKKTAATGLYYIYRNMYKDIDIYMSYIKTNSDMAHKWLASQKQHRRHFRQKLLKTNKAQRNETVRRFWIFLPVWNHWVFPIGQVAHFSRTSYHTLISKSNSKYSRWNIGGSSV